MTADATHAPDLFDGEVLDLDALEPAPQRLRLHGAEHALVPCSARTLKRFDRLLAMEAADEQESDAYAALLDQLVADFVPAVDADARARLSAAQQAAVIGTGVRGARAAKARVIAALEALAAEDAPGNGRAAPVEPATDAAPPSSTATDSST